MRTLDVLSALSALGGLPSLINTVNKYARYAITWLRRRQRRLPLAILLTCVATMLVLQGCAPVVLRESTVPLNTRAPPAAPNAPNAPKGVPPRRAV
jgi:hypothetical protein